MTFRVVKAATVIPVRRRPVGAGGGSEEGRRTSISEDELLTLGMDGDSTSIRALFTKGGGTLRFTSPWEVLMGQNECRNYFKSKSSSDVHVMRYPGELKFPGGTLDPEDVDLVSAATREFEEEFLVAVPNTAKLSLFNVKQTKVIKGISHLMHNFLALQDDNPWLAELSVDRINVALAERRERFAKSVASGEFFGLTKEEKSHLSPEVHSVAWMPLAEVVWFSMTSKSNPPLFINDFQQREFEELGISQRDPMFQTMASLLELEQLPDEASLRAHCERKGSEDELVSREMEHYRKYRKLPEVPLPEVPTVAPRL